MENPQDQTINKHSREHPTKKQEPLSELNNTLGEIDNAIKDFDGASLTSEQQSRLREIKGKIINSTRKFLGVVRVAALVGSIMGSAWLGAETAGTVINYKTNHHSLEKTIDAGGQTIYTHPDERTTHYLNILAGRTMFTDEDLKFTHENNRTAEDLNKHVGLSEQAKDVYGLVWQLEEECGNPRIRFKEEGKHSVMVSPGDAFYDAEFNVLYIGVDDLISGRVVVEMSHGKQLEDNLLGSLLMSNRDLVKAIFNSGFSAKGFKEAYDKLYNVPGSFQYQAHKVIQPDLENRYPITPYLQQIKGKDSK